MGVSKLHQHLGNPFFLLLEIGTFSDIHQRRYVNYKLSDFCFCTTFQRTFLPLVPVFPANVQTFCSPCTNIDSLFFYSLSLLTPMAWTTDDNISIMIKKQLLKLTLHLQVKSFRTSCVLKRFWPVLLEHLWS